jgi:hypothetical protein
MTASFWWNDAPLRAAIDAKTVASMTEAGGVARAACPWNHVAATVHANPSPSIGSISASSPDALLCEFGAGPHEIAPHNLALKFTGGDGGFVQFPVGHPGFGGTPFLRTGAAAWPGLFGAGGIGGFGLI